MVDSAKKASRKQWVIAIGGISLFVVLLVFGMWVSDPNKGKPDPREVARLEAQEVRKDYKARSVDAVTPQERWISKSEQELAAYKTENRDLKQKQAMMEKKLGDIEALLRSDKFNQPANNIRSDKFNQPAKNNSSNASPALGSLPPPPNPNRVPVVTPGGQEQTDIKNQIAGNILPPSPQNKNSVNKDGKPGGSSIQVFDFDDNSTSKKKKESRNIAHALPTGAFGKIVLLSGVDAPTGGEAENNPVPILMRLLDYGTLPNYFHSEIKDCHVTGAVRGDLSSERCKIRTERLSCVLIDGDIIDVPLKGWVNGEDGKEGFRGRVVEKAGALLARTFVAGTFSGIGNNVAMQYQNVSQSALGSVTSIDPSNVGKAGLATGLSTSMEKLADYYMERANEMYPIIEIGANRIGELVLQEGVDLERNIIGNMSGEQ
jgi:conjugal transfer pilus assembly protein TraB